MGIFLSSSNKARHYSGILLSELTISQPKPSDITPAQVLLPDPTYSIRYLSEPTGPLTQTQAIWPRPKEYNPKQP